MDENMILHKLIDLIQYKDTYQYQSSGIPPQDMYVLERVNFYGDIQIRDISKNYSIPPSTLTGILDRLETKKYIRRIRKKDDRRAVGLAVTDEGKVLLQKHIREDSLFAHNLFHILSGEKKRRLMKLLVELLDGVDKEKLFIETKEL